MTIINTLIANDGIFTIWDGSISKSCSVNVNKENVYYKPNYHSFYDKEVVHIETIGNRVILVINAEMNGCISDIVERNINKNFIIFDHVNNCLFSGDHNEYTNTDEIQSLKYKTIKGIMLANNTILLYV